MREAVAAAVLRIGEELADGEGGGVPVSALNGRTSQGW